MSSTRVTAFGVFAFLLLFGSANAYTTQIYAPAVLSGQYSGVMTLITLNVTPGSGSVQINGPTNVAFSTLDSAQTAVAYATSYLNVNQLKYNFIYDIHNTSTDVSGPSAGLAFTLLAVYGLQQKQLPSNFTVTGTINPNGSVGIVGGVYDKMGAAEAAHMKFGLVPFSPNGSFEDLVYYITQQNRGITLTEVSNVSQAISYLQGTSTRTPISLNVSHNYHVESLPTVSSVNSSDKYMNLSAFYGLTNFTINSTAAEINSLSSQYSNVKTQLFNNLNEYKLMAKKGYLYTAADFAFQDYQDAYVIKNSAALSVSNATSLIRSVSSYCQSLVPPQTTASNYEYVIGGELRQSWGNYTATSALALLNASQSSDDIIDSIYTAASAYGWCAAASQMYGLSSTNNTNNAPVTTNQNVQTQAYNLINQDKALGPSMYLQSAQSNYDLGNYAAALYAATYASIFLNPSLGANLGIGAKLNATNALISNATYGAWPIEFSKQAIFYINEAKLQNSSNYINNAYEVGLLASNLSSDNRLIFANLAPYSQSVQIVSLQKQINQLKDLLAVIAILQLVIFVLLIYLLLMTRTTVVTRQRQAKRR